jgi:hypothetical protein
MNHPSARARDRRLILATEVRSEDFRPKGITAAPSPFINFTDYVAAMCGIALPRVRIYSRGIGDFQKMLTKDFRIFPDLGDDLWLIQGDPAIRTSAIAHF